MSEPGHTQTTSTTTIARQARLRLLLRGIGLAALGLILSQIDIPDLVDLVRGASIGYLVAAVPLFFALIAVKALRWGGILRAVGIDLGFRTLLHAYLASFYLGAVTPGRLGEVIKVLYVTERGHPRSEALFCTLLDRAWDIAFLVIVGSIAMVRFASFFAAPLYLVAATMLLLLLTVAGVVQNRGKGKSALRRVLGLVLPESLRATTEQVILEFVGHWSALCRRDFGIAFLATFISWLLYYVQIYLLTLGIGVPLSFFEMVLMVTLASLMSLLPITVAGIGTRDVTLIALFGLVGLPVEMAVALSLSILALFVVNAVMSLGFWYARPVQMPG